MINLLNIARSNVGNVLGNVPGLVTMEY